MVVNVVVGDWEEEVSAEIEEAEVEMADSTSNRYMTTNHMIEEDFSHNLHDRPVDMEEVILVVVEWAVAEAEMV